MVDGLPSAWVERVLERWSELRDSTGVPSTLRGVEER
jgi:hypothetical protein